MIEALQEAQNLWQNPAELIRLWDSLESKKRHESIIAELVAAQTAQDAEIADLGCGVGRYANVLNFGTYEGYDGSPAMVMAANDKFADSPKSVKFACVDIFKFQIHKRFDAVICIDVVHHQNDPIQAILQLLNIWNADVFVISLLVGGIREDLYNSTVIPFTDLLKLCDAGVMKNILHVERFDDNSFAWMVLECRQN